MPKETLSERISKSIGSTMSLIIHTIIFIAFFVLIGLGYSAEKLLLILTTLVSLEAIYLAIFIQMSVNKNTESLEEVEEDLEELSDDIEDVTESLEEVEGELEEISEDIEEDNKQDDIDQQQTDKKFQEIHGTLENILKELQALKK